MKKNSDYAKEQYEWVRGSRKVLFDYCRTLSPENFIEQNTGFGQGGSIRNLLVHIATTYQFWIAKNALKKDIAFYEFEANKNMDDIETIFNIIDSFVLEFIEQMENPENEIEYEINGMKNSAKPFKLFSHVITHEFHHKGQILSLSRHMGYSPIDTDIMR